MNKVVSAIKLGASNTGWFLLGFLFQPLIAFILYVLIAIIVILALTVTPGAPYKAPNVDFSKCEIYDTLSATDQTYKIKCKG